VTNSEISEILAPLLDNRTLTDRERAALAELLRRVRRWTR